MLESNNEGFNHIRKALMDAFKLETHKIPSYYYVTKYRPKIFSSLFEVDESFSYLTRESKLKKKVRKLVRNIWTLFLKRIKVAVRNTFPG